MNTDKTSRKYFLSLTIGALGVVYGDIGTSPLYALRECFHGAHAIPITRANVLGVLSLIFWSLIVIVSIKYLGLILKADNKGEGGILALLSLAFPEKARSRPRTTKSVLIWTGLFGTALLYGDGIITPAISVLSAVEGLSVATPFFTPYILPITGIILVALFSIQRFGTGKVGNLFGRVTFVWFVTLALLGIKGIVAAPEVLTAFNPVNAVRFFATQGWHGFVVLGAVFLVVTGAEALYADMGHFGKSAMRWAWFVVVLPALVLNYLGQGALLLTNPAAAENPFYRLAPSWGLYPLVVLATSATVIASQALISGAFSLTMQAVQLGYLPRIKIEHTSSHERGQIYIPKVNWALMCACIALVAGFGSSTNLAAAYGIAVSLTMVITTTLFYCAARGLWEWSRWKAALISTPFLAIESAFLIANSLKIAHGGWFPLTVGIIVFTMLTTWKTGRSILAKRLESSTLPIESFLQQLLLTPPTPVKGTAIYLSGRKDSVPLAMLHNLKHNKVLHEKVIFLTVLSHDKSHIDDQSRIEVRKFQPGFYQVVGHYGFMEEPDVPGLLRQAVSMDLEVSLEQCTYFLGKETVIPSGVKEMAIWRERLFALMNRNASSAAAFFRIPPNRVVELGMQVEI